MQVCTLIYTSTLSVQHINWFYFVFSVVLYPLKMSGIKKRASYPANFKLKVILFAKKHGNKAAAREFGSPPTAWMIGLWRKQEEEISQLPRTKRAARGKPATWPNLEKTLKHWVQSQRMSGLSVSTKIIMDQGRRIAREMMESNDKGEETANFKGTPNWCFLFMKRNGLSLRTRTKLAQKMPAAYEEKILQFHSYVINLRKNTNFELSQIANMDEVPLTFDVPSNRTVDQKGVKTVSIKTSGHEKTHYTVVLACCANGTKLPPMLIFKRKTLPKESLPRGVVVHVQEERVDESRWYEAVVGEDLDEKIWSPFEKTCSPCL